MDPFDTLGVEARFDLDLPAVEKTHRELSRALHPDRYVGASASERRAALGKAVEVNEAWRILRDPIRRAEALLALRGVTLDERRETKADPEFLMEMLEQREALAEAKQARDLEARTAHGGAIEQRSRGVEAALTEGFARGEAAALVARGGRAQVLPALPRRGERHRGRARPHSHGPLEIFDPKAPPRPIGIDLGTTNSLVAYVQQRAARRHRRLRPRGARAERRPLRGERQRRGQQ